MVDDNVKMTYEGAIERIPQRDLPEFWVSDLDALNDQLDAVKRGRIEEIAASPSGRPIRLVTYGSSAQPERKANFNSAVAAGTPEKYANPDARETPVVFLVGPVHGHEVEGLTGLCNLLSVLETGHDLRGTEQPALRELAEKCRIVLLPCGNPDGLARFEPDSLRGLTLADLRFWGQGTWADNRLVGWPDAKQQHPMTGNNVGFLGCYFDDDGVNPMHDEFFDPMGPEAPAILTTARQEAPDVTVSLHSHGLPPTINRTRYLPLEVQSDIRSLHCTYNTLLSNRDLPRQRPVEIAAESGSPPPHFNLLSAAYHASGTTSVLHECPHGLTDQNMCDVTHKAILEAQLTLYEATFRHAINASES